MAPAARQLAAPCLAAAAVLALPGCGGAGKDEASVPVAKGPLTIYTSLPRRDVSARRARSVALGADLALRDAGARAGGRRIRLVRLDSTRAGSDGAWDPGAVNENAKRAADDPRAVAYLGELEYGASAVSLPTTNDAGILQISPGDGLTSLTVTPPEDPRAGPDRYYPSDRRNFVRLVPSDLRLAAGLVQRVLDQGARTATIVTDRRIYGRELAGVVAVLARRRGLRITGVDDFPRDLDSVEGTAGKLASERPAAVILTGVADATTPALLRALRRRLPRVSVFGAAGLGARPLPGKAPARVSLLSPLRTPSTYPASGRALLGRLRARLGTRAGLAGLYGYEAMRLALEAIDAGGPVRSRIVRAARTRGRRDTALGRIEVRPTGDVSERRFGLYTLRRGEFRHAGTARQRAAGSE